MKKQLQNIQKILEQNKKLTAKEKQSVMKALEDVDKELEVTAFKLERTEQVKKTTATLLEETIQELEQKRKAVEAQNRELEIETALEKVRSSALAMKQPEDMIDVCRIISDQLEILGVTDIRNIQTAIINDQKGTYLNYEYFTQYKTTSILEIVTKLHQVVEEFAKEILKSKDAFFIKSFEGEALKDWIEYRKNTNQNPDPILESTKSVHYYFFSIGPGGLGISTYSPLTDEEIKVFKRFRNVFELAYRRFIDIELAIAQAREAQIELALERIRARTMAMQKSDELAAISFELFKQVQSLGVATWHCAFHVYDDDQNSSTEWGSNAGGTYPTYKIPRVGIFQQYYDIGHTGESLHIEVIGEDRCSDHYKWLCTLPGVGEQLVKLRDSGVSFPTSQIDHVAFFKHGYLIFITYEAVPQAHDIFKRFARVFEQTYTRFLDLKKAEEQAREAKIEAALEKVRARAMGMQKSDELGDVADVLFKELNLLVENLWTCGFVLCERDKTEDEWWLSIGDGFIRGFYLPNIGDATHENMYKAWRNGESYHTEQLEGDALKQHYDWLMTIPVAKQIFEEMAAAGFTLPTWQKLHCAYFSKGYLVIITQVPCSEEQIFVRFAQVFDLTYTRFLDLQKAEAQAREAVKQASLDRIRGEIASMRTSEDLNRITPIIWRELKTLEVPFIRCGVFIVDEENEKVQVYLTTPDGKSLGVLSLPFDANKITSNTVEHWKKNQVYKEHWNKEEFIKWTKSMIEIGQVQNAQTYQGSSTPPESLDLHFVPFTQGMLYVGNVCPLSDEKLDLVKTLAKAFSIAYARYADFKHIEEAKNKIEVTLSELKSTQAQLIHSEKLASLGELTAGIAHEIKNPLNFVNNFSEVSRELLDEMQTELQNKNDEEVLEIIESLKQNLERINQHGKRADSIVKGMLLHSRGTSGEKMLTDINNLLDEYVNLAYHGMRAKDKDFNITIETEYDKSIEKINIVPQDISRVFLNIINNACYAINDKSKDSSNDFVPTLKVFTKNMQDKVEIRIGDNGNGIPSDILDKIFQPFFTTKPTGEGTGLGLSLSYDIVTKMHGGELKVETKADEGAEFIITLPHG